jgi:hypothetical protein
MNNANLAVTTGMYKSHLRGFRGLIGEKDPKAYENRF